MGRFGFCGPSYTSQSPNADDERCLNWYPELIEGSGKSQFALYPTPGLSIATNLVLSGYPGNLPLSPIRAMTVLTGTTSIQTQRLFAIVGNFNIGSNLYEITVHGGAYTPNLLGSLPAFSGNEPLVSMCTGGGHAGSVFMAVDSHAYYYTNGSGLVDVTNTIATGGSFSQVGYCDGFFLALLSGSGQIFASAPLDVTTWPGASTTIVNVFPDNINNMVINQRQMWLLGQTASVVYYDSGNSPFPFDVIPGSYIEHGSIAKSAAVKIDNSIFWLAEDVQGQAIVWRANGYIPERISNHAVEFAIQSYKRVPVGGADRFGTGIDDAVGYSYQDQGHTFYVLLFPSANNGNGATWVYDIATSQWHERAFLNPATGLEQAHSSRCHAFWQPTDTATNAVLPARHLVGDWQNTGNIYEMQIPASNGTGGWTFADDFGNPIKRLRRSPHINLEKEWILHHQLEIDLETGLGPIPPLLGGQLQSASVNFNALPNQNPIGSPWIIYSGVPFVAGQILGGLYVGQVGAPTDMVYGGGVAWTPDQFSEGVINTLNHGFNFAVLHVRGNPGTAAGYNLILDATFGGIPGALAVNLFKSGVLIQANSVFGVAPGDIFRLEVVTSGANAIITYFHNGVLINTFLDTTPVPSGSPGIAASPEGGGPVTDVAWSSWSGESLNPVLVARDPQIMLRWSDDGGHTWSNQLFVGAGQAGKYKTRARFNRLGRSRQRIYEVSATDPIPWRMVDAYLKASPIYQPEERLVRKLAKSS
jgi:hypothetical protein